jgi:hypothetical protein
MRKIRTYSELIRLETFEERFDYLKLFGKTGTTTFGFDRYLNQNFYRSREWRSVRNLVIVRDDACDLAMPDRSIFGAIRVHHMNPITVEDFEAGSEIMLDPEFLICVSHRTHNAIHFGNKDNLTRLPKKRTKGDTTLW